MYLRVSELKPGDVVAGNKVVNRVYDAMFGHDSVVIVYTDGTKDEGGIYPSTLIRVVEDES